jgi:hypothetical protein
MEPISPRRRLPAPPRPLALVFAGLAIYASSRVRATSVYVQDGKTHISTLLPTSITHFFPNAEIEGVAAEVETAVLNIVNAAR